MTATEFEAFLVELHAEVTKKIARPLYVIDHPSVHTVAKLPAGFKLAKHPRYGSDFNKVVEHLHGDLHQRYCDWLDSDEAMYPPDGHRQKLTALFYETPRAFYDKAVQSLPRMYDHIAKSVAEGGSDGGYPPTWMRK